MIDTHCHLTFPDFAGRVDEVMDEASSAGVTGAITISTTTEDCLDALAIARSHDRVWCSAGVHPLHSAELGPEPAWGNLRVCGEDARCVAWGELGLDLHYDGPHRATQGPVLEAQLAWLERWTGEGLAKPVVLHCREAFAELIPILKRSSLPSDGFVFHCFTGGPDEVRACLDFGAMVSFTGVATYKNAEAVRDAAGLVPDDRIMVETDAPFLSPEPKRGVRPCQPAFVAHTARRLADVRGVAFEVFHEQLNANTRRFFGVG
ncbi:MAG: TatD family hydrolase [Planctomycetota bacterium]